VLVLNLLKVCKVSVSKNESEGHFFTPRGLSASRTGEQCLASCRWSLIMLIFWTWRELGVVMVVKTKRCL